MNEKEFETLSVNKIIMKYSFFGIITMLFASMNMIIDGMFVGNYIGSDALAAINLIMPIVMIIFAVSDLVAAGASVKVSISLGEKDYDKASSIFTSSILMIETISIIIMLLGILFAKDLIYTFIEDTNLANLAYDYVKVMIPFIPIFGVMYSFDNYLNISGKADYSMYVNVFTSLLNIVLNAIFIGYMRKGIEFAALSTVISSVIGAVFLIYPFVAKKVTLRFTKPKTSLKEIKEIIYNGSSEFLGNISGSLMSLITNATLLHFGGVDALTAVSIVMYVEMMMIPILFGLVSSVLPAVSYNYGAKLYARVKKFFKITSIYAVTISITAMVIMLMYPEFLVSIFLKNNNSEIMDIAKTAIILYAPSHLFSWMSMIVGTFFTSLEKPKESIIIMGLESVIIPIILYIVLIPIMGINGVFLAPTISAMIVSIYGYYLWKKRTKILLSEDNIDTV